MAGQSIPPVVAFVVSKRFPFPLVAWTLGAGRARLDFKNRLKGNITQSLFVTLLEDVNYRIVPLGIEEIVREVKNLDQKRYLKLGLSPTLRKLPDFFVSSPDFGKTFLVEIKYRISWSNNVRDRLGKDVLEQVKQWQPIHLIVFLGTPARKTDTPASYLGVGRLVYRDNRLHLAMNCDVAEAFDEPKMVEKFVPWEKVSWDNFSRFQDVFDKVSGRWSDSTLTNAIDMVKSLNSISGGTDKGR